MGVIGTAVWRMFPVAVRIDINDAPLVGDDVELLRYNENLQRIWNDD